MNLRAYQSAEERRIALEKELKKQFSHVSNFSFDESIVSTKNCENLIGATHIPLGVAGPLKVESQKSKVKNYFIPLATTEGALVASISRGCKVVTESGGVSVFIERSGMTRGPVFATGSLKKGKEVTLWIKKNITRLEKIAQTTSSHIMLTDIMIRPVGEYLFVRFSFDTQDAMGMNMVTIATEKLVAEISNATKIDCISVAGNFDIDKKPAWLNVINNRGFVASADIVITKELVKKNLKTTSEKIFDVWLAKCMIGSAMSGSLGFNAHFANIIAALFLATGQDPAHVVEGSLGITTIKVLKNGDLYVSIYLPALLVGTVGGGTHLATQQESLALLGVSTSEALAEVVAGTVLAGELSLLASLAEGTLAKAHKKLGRGIK
ncbi:MAG TPA: hydroxymethylglutaryl-CoA reductase [Patescibacteria group bacterium]|nr:hydroxymethylglutaryl-CoA reductase [Patescibacteria group bacterium]